MTKAAIADQNVTALQRAEEAAEQADFGVVKAARSLSQHRTTGHAKEHDQAKDWKTTSWLLVAGLGITFLVGRGISCTQAGAIDCLERPALQQRQSPSALEGFGSGGVQGFLQPVFGQASPRLTISAGVLVRHGAALQG